MPSYYRCRCIVSGCPITTHIKLDSQGNFMCFTNGRCRPVTNHVSIAKPDGHPPCIRQNIQKNFKYFGQISSSRANIKNKILAGVSTLNAVESEILKISHKVTGSVGKHNFYNNAYRYAAKNVGVTPLYGEKNIETFDDIRSVLSDPRNDKHKWALRDPKLDDRELILKDDQIDQNFIIFQTPAQRKIMAASTILNVDQNDGVTPEGACRTLTICSCYKGKLFHFKNIQIHFFLKKKYFYDFFAEYHTTPPYC
jgi:hypothetical protein